MFCAWHFMLEQTLVSHLPKQLSQLRTWIPHLASLLDHTLCGLQSVSKLIYHRGSRGVETRWGQWWGWSLEKGTFNVVWILASQFYYIHILKISYSSTLFIYTSDTIRQASLIKWQGGGGFHRLPLLLRRPWEAVTARRLLPWQQLYPLVTSASD